MSFVMSLLGFKVEAEVRVDEVLHVLGFSGRAA